MKQGIDISKHQGTVDWAKLAAQHRAGTLDFVIIRAGYGGSIRDPKFEANYAAATAAGIPVGAYWYAYWQVSPTKEAQGFLAAVEGKIFQYGIWYDVEYEPSITSLTKTARTTKTLEALDALAASGRYVGLYASVDMLNNRMETERLRGYDIWAAQYGQSCASKLPYGIWQYSSKGRVEGISGNVDLDYAYKDYPAIVTGRLAGAPETDKPAGNTPPSGGGKTPADAPDGAGGQTPTPGENAPQTGAQGGTGAASAQATRRYLGVSGGDALQMLSAANKLSLRVFADIRIGPASTGDDRALTALADKLKLVYEEV